MRKRFKIFLPDGSEFKPPKECMVVMNAKGLFFLIDFSGFYVFCRPLHEYVPIYDVKWEK